MKAAYSEGPSALLKDTFRKNVEETLPLMSMAEFPVAIKQILLYIKSTVENFGAVRVQDKLTIQLKIYTTHHILLRSSPKTQELLF